MLLRIDHAGIIVPDLDAAIDRHIRLFGARLVCRQHQPVYDIEECMIALDESEPGRGSYVQLLEPRGDSHFRDFLRDTGGGLHHIAYAVDDVDAAYRHFVQQGVVPQHPIYRDGTMGAEVFFLEGEATGGVLTEIVQPGTAWGPVVDRARA
jgi:methylmalonyl-CoA/ethylmalonyl-CoA epimerase